MLVLCSETWAQDCPPGTSATTGNGASVALCEDCEPGFFSATSTDSAACTACPEGQSSLRAATGPEQCTPIVSGRCSGNTDSATDVRCPPGSALLAGAASLNSSTASVCCESCPVGTYTAGTITLATDPCITTQLLSAGDTLTLDSFGVNKECSWLISCGEGVVELTFEAFFTDGVSAAEPPIYRAN